MSWAQRLKRVFKINLEVYDRCGGAVKVIACIEDQETIDRILDRLRGKELYTPVRPPLALPTRAPPGMLSPFAAEEPALSHQHGHR